MRPEVTPAERRQEVREAARAWKRARVIDEPALSAIEALYPDDRVRVGPVFRGLFFLFTLVAIGCATVLIWELGFREFGALAFSMGVGCLALTELQVGRLRRSQGGTEAATSLLSALFLIFGILWFLTDVLGLRGGDELSAVFLTSALLFALASWRWGFPLYAGVAAGFLFLLLARWPGARLWWVLVPVAVFLPLLWGSESARLAPSHRRACEWALAVSLATLYTALNLGSFDASLVEHRFLWQPLTRRSSEWRWLFILATAVVPLVVLALGIRSRRKILIYAGLLMGIASLVTLRFYVHLAPLWIILAAAGAVTIGLVFAIRRVLDSGAGKERAGFTAESLFENLERRSVLEVGAAVSTFSPAAQAASAGDEQFKGGGAFGGGGASGSY